MQQPQQVLSCAALRDAQARFEVLSKQDGLTELLNQRGWEEALQREQQRVERTDIPAAS